MTTRRAFLISASALALVGPKLGAMAREAMGQAPTPIPLIDITLTPSIYKTSIETNADVLMALEPDRLLHNFRWSAGLEPKAPVYGGWEARSIAGHTLGHYLTACSITASRGDEQALQRVEYIIAELAACQAAHGDGYVGGTTVGRDGEEVDGKIIFEEIRRGEIRTSGFDINGGWVPLYTWDKVQAGLIDAYQVAGVEAALPVLIGMSTYLAEVLETLDHEQMQTLLAAEHGGINYAYAELYAITGNKRWLTLAERLRHEAVLDPLAAGEDKLSGLHANTQIPKVIGLARLHELTGKEQYAETSRFFYDTVIDHHTFSIGGNSNGEHFGPPDTLADMISARTCEACNSYNMLKLTRHLWQWQPDAELFDDYERTYINHIMAHQHPETGMYVYFMPLATGAVRNYSTLEESFWCCFGSGLESHAKHGDSAFWQQGGETLFVNLFMPAEVDWKEGGMALSLVTDYPRSEQIAFTIDRVSGGERTIALRLPGWCKEPAVMVNGEAEPVGPGPGYVHLTREWKAGDTIEMALPMPLYVEATPGDESLLSFRQGPLVLAGDLGPGDEPFVSMAPALVTDDVSNALQKSGDYTWTLAGALPAAVTMKPFYDQYENRTAVYFPQFTQAEWDVQAVAFRKEQAARRALEARTVDLIRLGEMQPERDHDFATNQSDVIVNGGRKGRTAWWGVGNFIEFTLDVRDEPMALQAVYWGGERNKNFRILIDGEEIAVERREGDRVEGFEEVEYDIPTALTQGKESVRVRIETLGSDAPVYEVRMISQAETGETSNI